LKAFHRVWVWVLLAGAAVTWVFAMWGQQSTRQQALALEQQGQNAEAEAAWQNIAGMTPRSPEAYAHLGLLEARQEHYDQAVTYYRKALALDSAMPGLELNLGLALFKGNKFRDAIEPFSVELRKHPGDQRLTILLGMAHYGMGDYLVAIPYLKQAAQRDPQNLPLRLTLAHSCLWSKQFECVLDVYKEILALNAESAEADMLAGEALDEKGDSPGAIEQFRAAAKANPKEPNVHFGLGYLLWTQSQYEDAAKEFQAELENDPQHAQARLYLGDSYVQRSEYAVAEPELEKAAAADPSQALAHRDLGIVYAETERKPEAIEELQKAIALDPKDVAPHWRLARLYQSMGRKDEAKVEFDKASTMNKATNEALYKKMSGTQAGQSPQ
jgi:tetratricopeptide (TPR) repeat protein